MYQALYRKWRPKTFDDVCDQKHVIETLKSQIESGRISHAYLFTGSRGTGKTSCAKILSKAVNCLHPVNGSPCNECEICKGIDSGSILDVIEIDAASNNGVDNIRDLREEANFTPVNAKYRVYIIDEVHMLSIGAFNALLKTLEEPPAHVIFILATTEIHKLPATILSRCQRFDFKRISPEGITSRLMYVAEKENVSLTERAASIIARIADGGMRDALSLLDRCFAMSNFIDETVVCSASGIASSHYLFSFSDHILKGDFKSALKLVSELHNDSCDIDSLCTELTLHFRNLMVAKTIKDCEDLIICSKDDLEEYRKQASQFKLSKILNCIEILEQTSKNIKNASNKKIQLEAAMVKMCGINSSDAGIDFIEYDNRIKSLEEKIKFIEAHGLSILSQSEEEKPVFENISEKAPIEAEQKEKAEQPDNAHGTGNISETGYIHNTEKTSGADNADDLPPFDMPESVSMSQPKAEEFSHPVEKSEAKNEIFEPSKAENNAENNEILSENDEIPDGVFTKWEEVIDKLRMTDAPLFGILAGSTAIVSQGRIIIKSDNATLHDFICSSTHSKFLSKAIFDTVGRKMKMAVATNDKPKEEKNPLEDIIGKINKFNS